MARLETRPPAFGGRNGGRVSRAACPRRFWAGPPAREGGPRGERPSVPGLARLTEAAVFGRVLPGDGPARGEAGVERGSPARIA